MTEIVLASSALILFLAALRRLPRGRVPPGGRYALWLLAVLPACALAACASGGKAGGTGLPEEYWGVYAPEYWTGGVVQARRYIPPRDTHIRIAVGEDYFGFVDGDGNPAEIEDAGLPSVHGPVYTKRVFSLARLTGTGDGVWTGYLQDKDSVAFYDIGAGGADCGATLAVADGRLILEYMPEGGPALYYFLNPETPPSSGGAAAPPEENPAGAAMEENARSVIARVQDGTDAGEWLPLMSCMDWGVLARAAVETGMDGGDGTLAATEAVMGAIERYVNRQGPDMTMAEYLYILSASAGLDGAPSEGYGYMIYRMYEANPSLFAYVALEMLPEERRGDVLDMFRGEWYFHRGPEAECAPGREETIALLEADLSAGVSASPLSEGVSVSPASMTLRGAGASFQLRVVNAYGVYALTYESSDPGVAAVDENGVVTAAGPGEAVVSMCYEGSGGPLDFQCRVWCDW